MQVASKGSASALESICAGSDFNLYCVKLDNLCRNVQQIVEAQPKAAHLILEFLKLRGTFSVIALTAVPIVSEAYGLLAMNRNPRRVL